MRVSPTSVQAWATAGAVLAAATVVAGSRATVAERVMTLTRASPWTLAASIPVAFKTHHPQGIVKIGETFFVSSVEVTVRTKPLPARDGGFDRDTGAGVGHLFKIDRHGALVVDRKLGDGSIYHPGGIDYDGTHLWVPVAEYRPDSRSIVYRVDPETLQATEVMRVPDHIGALAFNTDDKTLHGVSWGSRRFYRWTVGRDGTVTNASAPLERIRTINASHYVDYQDCKYLAGRRMLCSGVTEIRQGAGAAPFRLGGLDVIDLADGRPVHQVPVLLWTKGGFAMTQNPAWIETSAAGLRAYFMPEDDTSTIYVYDVEAR